LNQPIVPLIITGAETGGFALIGPTAFLVVCLIIQKMSKEEKRIRNGLAFLAATV